MSDGGHGHAVIEQRLSAQESLTRELDGRTARMANFDTLVLARLEAIEEHMLAIRKHLENEPTK